MTNFRLRTTVRSGLLLTLSYAATVTFAQDATGDVLTKGWAQASSEQRVSAISTDLMDSSNERRALALNGIALLVAENQEAARRSFPPSSIRPYMLSRNSDVSKTATRAYFAVSETDAQAETDLVAMISRGEMPLPPIDYIRYIRREGIASDAARRWLTSLAVGPISDQKYAAVHALVVGSLVRESDTPPPPPLLPQVMALIRSPEYFCDTTLVLSLEKFGPQAAQYVDELVALRAKLESEARLPVDDRSVTLRSEFDLAAPLIDGTIKKLQR